MKKFWEELGECLKSFENGRGIFLLGDVNAKIGGEEIGGVVRKWGVEGVNENGEYLVDICAGRGLFLTNTFFQHKMIHRYTWRLKNTRSLIDYIALDERMKKEVLDVKVVRRMLSGSDHFAVLAKVRIRFKWEFWGNRRCKKVHKELASEKLCGSEYKETYRWRVNEVLREVRLEIGDESRVNDAFEVFKR